MVTTCQACQLAFDARPHAPRCPRCGTVAHLPGHGAVVAPTVAAHAPLWPAAPVVRPPSPEVPRGDHASRLTVTIVLSILAFLGACVNPIAPVAIIWGIVAYSTAQGPDPALAARRVRTAFRLAVVAAVGTVAIWVGLAVAWSTGALGG